MTRCARGGEPEDACADRAGAGRGAARRPRHAAGYVRRADQPRACAGGDAADARPGRRHRAQPQRPHQAGRSSRARGPRGAPALRRGRPRSLGGADAGRTARARRGCANPLRRRAPALSLRPRRRRPGAPGRSLGQAQG